MLKCSQSAYQASGAAGSFPGDRFTMKHLRAA
jgi:hypothetical protein